MGCMSSNQRMREASDLFDQQPPDTELCQKNDLPLLSFHALLTNMKVKRCPYSSVSMKVQFGDFEEFELAGKQLEKQSAKVAQLTIQWSVEYKLQFKATLYDLRKKFIVITFIDGSRRLVDILKINLYILATGPYHQDFAVNDKGVRVSFNLKIAQLVKVRIVTDQAEMIPREKEYPGDRFAFTLRSIMGEKIDESQRSYVNVISFDDRAHKSTELIDDEEGAEVQINQQMDTTPTRVRRANSNYQPDLPINEKMVRKKQIKWSRHWSKEMPQLEFTIPLYDLHSASLNIIFWALEESSSMSTNQLQESECFVSINKLLSEDFTIRRDPVTLIQYQDRTIVLELKNLNHGKDVGRSIFKFRMSIQTHVKQMQVCVRTERGILSSSPVFSNEENNNSKTEQIEEIKKLTSEIQTHFMRGKVSMKEIKEETGRCLYQINSCLRKQRELLSQSSKESRLTFSYKDEKELLKGQTVLIDLGFKILEFMDEDREDIANDCWLLLSTLIKRGELTLAMIGYSKSQQESAKNEPSSFLKRKHKISLKYQQLMNQLLKITLNALNTYTAESEREFAELFCAYAYFRIPQFRNIILSIITKADDPEIQEWRGTDFNLYEQPQGVNQNENVYELMFDWENQFYKLIEKEEGFQVNINALDIILGENKWEQRMAKRGGAFFAFVRYWVTYVENVAVNSKHVNWKYFPGYNKILHSFLVEMKNKSLASYSPAFKKAAACMLSNEKLLNPFVLILFKKTNINDQVSILKSFQLIHLFFDSIHKRGRSISATFDFKLFLKSIRSIVQGESSYSIGKVLVLLYDHFKLFPMQLRIEMSMYLIAKAFFRLFLHWSPNVRTIFHHLIYIRIYHQASKPFEQLESKDQEIYKIYPEYVRSSRLQRTEITNRFERLFIILENAQGMEAKMRRNIPRYDKELYRWMRKNLADKRRQKANDNDQSTNGKHQSYFNISVRHQRVQLMEQLSQPKLQRYNSEILNKNLKVVLESLKTRKRDEIIKVKNNQAGNRTEDELYASTKRRKINFFQNPQYELTPLGEKDIMYISRSLQEYHKINQHFIKHVEKNKDSVPVVRLEMNLDEKQLRPEGLDLQIDEW